MERVDQSCSFELDVTGHDVEAFARLTGDRNRLHVSPEYARTTEYGRPIVHGAFLVGIVSRVLGMHIPGERSVILSLSVRFPKPLFYPARVHVTGHLRTFDPDRAAGTVHVDIVDAAKGWTVLESDVAFGLHAVGQETASESRRNGPPAQPAARPRPSSNGPGRRRLLVTGGTGGIGSRVLPDLAAVHDLTLISRKSAREIRGQHAALGAADVHQVDLEDDGVFERWLDGLDPAGFYGVVHLSSPAVSTAFASDDIRSVRQHLRHAVEVPLLVARWARQSGSAVRRIVLIGSTFGSIRPRPHLGAYSLGKAAMEHLARLLASDLAAQGATVNVVAPGVMPVGLNEGLSERAQKSLAGRMPTARLVEPADVAGVIAFLLSDSASQINGSTIAVHGGAEE